jgi:hypothetical protein
MKIPLELEEATISRIIARLADGDPDIHALSSQVTLYKMRMRSNGDAAAAGSPGGGHDQGTEGARDAQEVLPPDAGHRAKQQAQRAKR